jgi:DNA processing protein
MDATLASWLALSHIKGLGNESLHQLLLEFGSPSAILATPESALKQIVRPAIAKAISQQTDNFSHTEISSWLDDPQNHIITIADTDYPQALLNIPDPPMILYVKGRLELLNSPAIAVVGSRNASTQGLRNAEAFAQALSQMKLTVISGLAHGIDTAAHMGGLRGLGSSIAVVGTGLDKVYPSANRELAHQLAIEAVLISEYPLGTPPLANNFPRRNRIISGLSLGCLIVEASLQSGSLITARLALEQGRDVFAIPGSIHSPQSKGCHALIKQGAKLVETPQDIVDELGWHSTSTNILSNPDVDNQLFEHLGFDPVSLDQLSERSNLTIEALSAILLQLELDGQVTTLAGGMYQRIV